LLIVDCPELKAVVDRQFGLVAYKQAAELGFTAEAIRATVHTGRWRMVLPKVYLIDPGARFTGLDVEQKRTAAGLYTAGLGHLSGLSALAWHGVADLPAHDTVLMLIPHQVRRVSYDFVRVQRTRRFDPTARQAGRYHVCGVARATADACRHLTDIDDVSRLVGLVIGLGRTTVGALRTELAHAGSSRTRPLRLVLQQFGESGGSGTIVDSSVHVRWK